MQQDPHRESPLNPLPMAVWIIALPIIASEAVFALGRLGLVGGAEGIGLRLAGLQKTAFVPEQLLQMWALGVIDWSQLYRIFCYPFVHVSFTHALLVLVFTLALGNMVGRAFRPLAFVGLFLGSAIGGALVFTAAAAWLPGRVAPLMGGYPAVYGLVGAFTFLLWTRLSEQNANRLRAFSLIGMLLLFQLVFGVLFGEARLEWVAELAGFGVGFGLSFLLIDGGIGRVIRQLRQR